LVFDGYNCQILTASYFWDRLLIDRVRLALSSNIPAWVLFSNGTVIVFDDPKPEDNLEEKALSLMKAFVRSKSALKRVILESLNRETQRDGWLRGIAKECILMSI